MFSELTPDWIIETATTCLIVPLPKATITGTLTINCKPIPVSGIGYHNHNWGYSPTRVLQNHGWFWGRMTAESFHVMWAKTVASSVKKDLIAALNKETSKQHQFETSVYNIQPNNINFSVTDFSRFPKFLLRHNPYLPYTRDSSKKDLLSADITMKALNIQYTGIFTIHYWQYLVHTNGTIQASNNIEKIQDKQKIIEFLSFKTPQWYYLKKKKSR